jgi:hypothetical protein
MDGKSPPGFTEPGIKRTDQKNPQIAGFCSSFIPEPGQVYNGEIRKGVLLFLGTLLGLFFILPGLVV